jgi:uncharacterized damage-inducible protein DinB
MHEIHTILSDLDHNTNALTEHILRFDESMFNKKPAEDKWSAAEVAEHLYVLDKFIYHIINSDTIPAERKADEKISLIHSAMNNLGKQYNAPEPIVPLGRTKDQNILVAKLIASRNDLRAFIESNDLSPVCLTFTHAGFGPMTRLEWIYFLMAHTKRHLLQFDNIRHQLQYISGT